VQRAGTERCTTAATVQIGSSGRTADETVLTPARVRLYVCVCVCA